MEKQKSTERNTSKTSLQKTKRRKRKKKIKPRKINPTYWVVLVNNGVRSVLKGYSLRSKDRKKALNFFDDCIKESTSVIFPNKHTVREAVYASNYELCLLRSIDDINEEVPMDKVFFGNWRLIKKESIDIEETFMIHGYCKFTERMNIKEISEMLMKKRTTNREIGVIDNKVVIFNDEEFDMVTTKCSADGARLGVALYRYLDSYKDFFYHGIYRGYDRTDVVDIVMEYTGMTKKQMERKEKNS